VKSHGNYKRYMVAMLLPLEANSQLVLMRGHMERKTVNMVAIIVTFRKYQVRLEPPRILHGSGPNRSYIYLGVYYLIGM
jgi:hypothetical protein